MFSRESSPRTNVVFFYVFTGFGRLARFETRQIITIIIIIMIIINALLTVTTPANDKFYIFKF